MRLFLDTSVLVELFHPFDAGAKRRAELFLRKHSDGDDLLCTSASVFLELQFTLTRDKKRRGWSLPIDKAAEIVARAKTSVIEPLVMKDVELAMVLQAERQVPIRDAVHRVVARRLGCEKFLTTDAAGPNRLGPMRVEVLEVPKVS